jgi:hypothetical protein
MTVIAAEAAGPAGEAVGARARAAAGNQAREQAKGAASSYAGRTARVPVPGGDKYEKIILAEFLIAVAVVAFLPLATGGPKDKSSPSPYTVNDIMQLTAIAVVYFILALLPGGASRWGAWLGLLVLLGVFYKKTATGELNVALTSIHPGQGPADKTV